jgi:hypothetical protein
MKQKKSMTHFGPINALLSVFRFFANHPPFLFAALVIHVFSGREYLKEAELCEIRANETTPDLMFGYSAKRLNNLYEVWGRDGREAYIKAANTNLFPYMETYAIILGAFLVVTAKRLGWKEDIAFLAVIAMLFDVCETLVQRYGSQVYPEKLSENTIALGSLCSQAKWILVGTCSILVILSFLLGSSNKQLHNSKQDTIAPTPPSLIKVE